jgi:hypothetical protein
MRNKTLAPILFLILMGACRRSQQILLSGGTFPDSPVNLSDMNSQYDDYNSTLNFVGTSSPLCFSTNRNSRGSNFDIIYKLLDVNMSLVNGKLTVAESSSNYLNDVVYENNNLNDALSKINTDADELGPNLIGQGVKFNGSADMFNQYQSYILLYANNESGNLDIKYVENIDQEKYNKPKPVSFLNSSKDDAYPSLMWNSLNFNSVYFCSNRNGGFDIYKTDLDSTKDLLDNLSDTSAKTITKDTILSSVGDDKCPYINENMMVFTSNRPGGYGGFDLYYSLMVNGKWSTPVNFGPAINTPYDEYRPIIESIPGFTNDFMIFSSNRPGGKGGFDLYYVGIKKMTTN